MSTTTQSPNKMIALLNAEIVCRKKDIRILQRQLWKRTNRQEIKYHQERIGFCRTVLTMIQANLN